VKDTLTKGTSNLVYLTGKVEFNTIMEISSREPSKRVSSLDRLHFTLTMVSRSKGSSTKTSLLAKVNY
jgi:hypothetical protein